MNRFKTAAATFGLLSISLVPCVRADDANKETVMTINHPVQVQDIVLAPGQHVFKLTEPNSVQTIVSIYNANQTQLEGIIMGMPAYRLDIDDTLFSVSQPVGNRPAMLHTWYFAGSNSGIEFRALTASGQLAHASKSKRNQQDTSPSDNATH